MRGRKQHTKRTACNAKRNVKIYKNKKQSKVGARNIHNNISPGRKSVRGTDRELQRVSATFFGGGVSRFKNDNGNFVNCLKD